jgi:hypothetical protein
MYYKVAELLAERGARALREFAALDTCTWKLLWSRHVDQEQWCSERLLLI